MFSRKAQQPGQIFVYILAIIIVGGIIAYGYTAIKDFSDRGEQVAFLSFKTDFENSVKTMVSDYGTIKRPGYDIPGKYQQVCIIDFKKQVTPMPSPSGTPEPFNCIIGHERSEPLACNAWEKGYAQYSNKPQDKVLLPNVFLTPDGSDSFHVANMVVPNGMVCAPVKNGKINLQLKSIGNAVEVTLY